MLDVNQVATTTQQVVHKCHRKRCQLCSISGSLERLFIKQSSKNEREDCFVSSELVASRSQRARRRRGRERRISESGNKQQVFVSKRQDTLKLILARLLAVCCLAALCLPKLIVAQSAESKINLPTVIVRGFLVSNNLRDLLIAEG